jgi:hypothetical protein
MKNRHSNRSPSLGKQDKKAQTKKRPQLGKLPPLYRFFLNQYDDVRFTSCPQCANKTLQRKLPLFIHVSPGQPLTLNKTCRYCPNCDLLIAHQDEIEDIMARAFTEFNPEVVGNAYLVIGTVERATWKRTMQSQLLVEVTLDALHDFKEVVSFKPTGDWME